MKQSFISQFFERLTTETPVFFKKILTFCASLAVLGVGLKGLDLGGIKLPFDLNVISGYLIAIGSVSALVAKTATTDPTLQAKGGSNILVNKGEPESTVAAKSPKI